MSTGPTDEDSEPDIGQVVTLALPIREWSYHTVVGSSHGSQDRCNRSISLVLGCLSTTWARKLVLIYVFYLVTMSQYESELGSARSRKGTKDRLELM